MNNRLSHNALSAGLSAPSISTVTVWRIKICPGAFADDGQQYALKVMAEKERMLQTLKRSQPQHRA